MQVFFQFFLAEFFNRGWAQMSADFFVGKIGCDLFCGNLPAGLSCEVPPSGRGVWVFLVRRYVSLRETHPRLCTIRLFEACALRAQGTAGHEPREVQRKEVCGSRACITRGTEGNGMCDRRTWGPPGMNLDREKHQERRQVGVETSGDKQRTENRK